MSAAQHTPGPWKQSPDAPWIIKQDCTPISEEAVSICSTTAHESSGFFPAPSEGRANARLIAAAPELLLALEMLLAWHLGTSEDAEDAENYSAVRDAIAAIAKATGSAA